jgi:hypothetical protein
MLKTEPDDSLLLPVVKPEVTGNQTVVLVHLAVVGLPVIVFARTDLQPVDISWHGDTGAGGPLPNTSRRAALFAKAATPFSKNSFCQG